MPNDQQASAASANQQAPQIQRSARVLLGWLSDEQALHFLTSQRRDLALTEAQQSRIREVREAVAKRRPGIDQSEVVLPFPEALQPHVDALGGVPAAAPFFKENWKVQLVDLRNVCALQPNVFTDHALERTEVVDASDVRSIAAVSLPLPSEAALPGQFDNQRQAWMISSPNPNLRIVGNFAGPVQPGSIGFGFIVAFLPSFLQVARIQGRYVLRDGYHRAYGFLKRGVTTVPAFVRDYGKFEDMGLPVGLLPPAVYLGDRPPTLADYADNEVSEGVELPATQKMIVIHGLELSPIG